MSGPKGLSWEPVLKGDTDTYCSPGCGHGCTKGEFFEASRRGLELSKRLGAGWSFRVSENLGWHYHAVSPCGRIKVSSMSGEEYTAFLGEPGPGCSGRWTAHAKTPQQAIQDVVAEGLAAFDEIADLLDDL